MIANFAKIKKENAKFVENYFLANISEIAELSGLTEEEIGSLKE
jgi:hypothetical protein